MSDSLARFASWAPVLAFLTCLGIVRWLVVGAARRVALDQPNERSLHTKPVPRLGGVGIVCGTVAGWAFVALSVTPSLWFGTLLLAGVSLAEDVRGVPMAGRFLAHFVAASVFVHTALASSLAPLPWVIVPFLVIGIVWVTNLYNFMDGSDGLAGGMATFGFGAYSLAAFSAGSAGFALASASIAAAAVAFLVFNFAPAKIFMGDIGSIPLGFLAAAFGVRGWSLGLWPAWLPFLVFSPFLVDASVTLAARQIRGEKVWQAHRSHYYQRLVLMGWGHRKVALAEYGLMAGTAGSALLARRAGELGAAALVAGWGLVYAVILRRVDVRWRGFQSRATTDQGPP